MTEKIVHVQALMTESDLARLKEKTGEKETKEAVAVAISKYLEE